jgi:valyl-tRNA synthetase
VHRASWPEVQELGLAPAGDEPVSLPAANGGPVSGTVAQRDLALDVVGDVLREVRKAKSNAKQPMRAPVTRVLVRDTSERLHAMALGADDLRAAGSIAAVDTEVADEFAVDVELAGQDAA